MNHPELWAEVTKLSKDPNLAVNNFRYGKTFRDIDEKLDQKIKEQLH